MRRELRPEDVEITTGTFLGAGLFVGTLKDGQNFVYHGGVVRVRRQDLSDPAESDNEQAWEAGLENVLRQVAALEVRSDRKRVKEAPLELCGCLEPETGDWLLLWRLACVEVVTH